MALLSLTTIKAETVACLGKLAPYPRVIHLQTDASSFPGRSPVGSLLVTEGESVSKDQVLATLKSLKRLESLVAVRQAELRISELRLEEARSPARVAQIAALQSNVEQLEEALAKAEKDHKRNSSLWDKRRIALSDYEKSTLAFANARSKLKLGRANLATEETQQATSLAQAEVGITLAEAQLANAEAEKEQAILRAPSDGHVLEINAYPGEHPGPNGILDFGPLDPLYVIAEVYEFDLQHIAIGAEAKIESPAFPSELTGVIREIGNQISRNRLFSNSPAANNDQRVVPVRIELQSPVPKIVQQLIGAQVNVHINRP